MAALPEAVITPPTVRRIYERYEGARGEWRRAHLGASQIGKPCDRELWYQFRWATRPSFDGRMLRLFDTGQREEARLVTDLRAIGVEVHEVDPETGQQFRVEAVGGHFGGSLDGAAHGFEESSQWHVCEFKTSNAKKFAELKKKGVQAAQPVHFAQMMVYMRLTGMRRAYYLAVCKDTDEIWGERIRYDADVADRLLDRAQYIITSPTPPARISEDADYFLCRWCDHRAICHEGQLPEVSCRTCVHATPETNGDQRWSCARWEKDLSVSEQKEACGQHLYIPPLLPWLVIDANPEENSITYAAPSGERKNGGLGGMDSATLREVQNARGGEGAP